MNREGEVTLVAHTLCDQQAAACNGDTRDWWNTYGNDFTKDAEAIVSALKSASPPTPDAAAIKEGMALLFEDAIVKHMPTTNWTIATNNMVYAEANDFATRAMELMEPKS